MWDSISRVSVDAKNGYWWINAVGIALTLTVAFMSIGAYNAAGEPSKAMLCVMAQIVAIAAAILARRSFTGHMPIAGIVVLVFAGGCAYWSSHGLALAWYGQADQLGVEVVFLALLEPGLFLLAEHIKEGREALARKLAVEAAEAAAALASAKERDERRLADGARRAAAEEAAEDEQVVRTDGVTDLSVVRRNSNRKKRRRATAVVAGMAAALAPGIASAEQFIQLAGLEQSVETAAGDWFPSYDDIDRAREAVARRGMKPTIVRLAAHMGVPKNRIARAWPAGRLLTDGLVNTWDVSFAS